MDNTVVIETGVDPDACVIWLHGLGADANDFVPVIPQLQLPSDLSIRFIFPNAPVIPITINQGYQMPGWYDITSIDIVDREEDSEGIARSSSAMQHLIDEQVGQGIDPGRIIIAGFSQGGAVALHVGLNYHSKLAGIMSLSAYLPDCADAKNSPHKDIDMFMAHGTEDDVVKFKYAEMSRKSLIESGFDVNWHEYPMPHSVCMEQIQDISRWLQSVLG